MEEHCRFEDAPVQPYTAALLKTLGEIKAEPDIRILGPLSSPKSAP